jgi:Wiskott-Aldrich syndrome protein
VFPEPPVAGLGPDAEPPPPPEPPAAPSLGDEAQSPAPPPPPPADVIVLKTELLPKPPTQLLLDLPDPPAPTVIGYVVAEIVIPVVAANGEAVCGELKVESFDSLKPPAPPPPPPPLVLGVIPPLPPPPATTR